MKVLLYFLVFELGALFGFVLMSLFSAAGDADREMGLK